MEANTRKMIISPQRIRLPGISCMISRTSSLWSSMVCFLGIGNIVCCLLFVICCLLLTMNYKPQTTNYFIFSVSQASAPDYHFHSDCLPVVPVLFSFQGT